MTTDTPTSDAAAILDFAAKTRGAGPVSIDLEEVTQGLTQWITTPAGDLRGILPAEVLGYNPLRPIGRTVADLASLVAYTQRHHQPTSEAFVGPKGVTVELDGTETGADIAGFAGPGRHNITWPLQHTPAFSAWSAIVGHSISQAQLAEVLDEWLATVQQPDAATMLELVEGFAVKSDVEFRAGQRLKDGSQVFSYAVDNKPVQLAVPDHITIAVNPYLDVNHTAVVDLKFSWRLREGKLSFTLKCAEWAELAARARATLVEQLGVLLPDVPAYVVA